MTTILNPDLERERQAADSRFFVPDETAVPNPDSLEMARLNILDLASLIGRLAGSSSEKIIELEQEVEKYGERIRTGTGLLSIRFPRRLTAYRNMYDPLIETYAVPTENTEALHVVTFPTDALTTCQALSFKAGTGYTYEPVINMKVQTALDEPVTVFDTENGGLKELPSQGHWYHFPLQCVSIDLLPVIQ